LAIVVIGGAYYAMQPAKEQQALRHSFGRAINAILNENPNESGKNEGGKGDAGKGESQNEPTDSATPSGNRFPDRKLPRDEHGNPVPDPEAEGAYTQLGQQQGRRGKYDQAREFDSEGKQVRDIDFTDHGRWHPNPHQHRYEPNPTGGTPQRG